MKSDPDVSTLIDALRDDLPSERDSARLRARLAALGIAASSGLSATTAAAATAGGAAKSAAAGAAGGATTGALGGAAAQATTWSLAVKVGVVAAVSASAVVAPAWVLSSRPSDEQRQSVAASASARAPAHGAAARPLRGVANEARSPSEGAETRDATDTTPAPALASAQSPNAAAARAADAASAESAAPPTGVARAASAAAAPTLDAPRGSGAPSVAGFDANSAGTAREATTLREETRLIDGALAALRGGDIARANALLSEHAQRFPDGLLRRERTRAERKLHELEAAKR